VRQDILEIISNSFPVFGKVDGKAREYFWRPELSSLKRDIEALQWGLPHIGASQSSRKKLLNKINNSALIFDIGVLGGSLSFLPEGTSCRQKVFFVAKKKP